MFRLRIEDHFDASHSIPGHAGKCRNLHGHTYKVEVFVTGQTTDSNGILENSDFIELKSGLRSCLSEFDHNHLNNILGNNATAENVSKILFHKLEDKGIKNLERVRVWESQNQYAEYWKDNEGK
ncbi:MAG: 6-carboxytetrahydropterin synthase [Candidatus Aenigmarchaeota archaeon]|nr:6-carboxytetrahydropterin synthase [Candidatus Aenigmarchaeota archaeon]